MTLPRRSAREGQVTVTENTEILTGEVAIGLMVGTWRDVGLGMVELDVIDPWLKVSRGGADWAVYLSLVDGTAVTVNPSWADRGSDEDVPNDLYPDGQATDEQIETLERGFACQSGSYPLPDDGVFAISMNRDGEYRQVNIGLLDDTFEIVDE